MENNMTNKEAFLKLVSEEDTETLKEIKERIQKRKDMTVSMDGLRIRLISDYNSLTRKLNNSIKDKSFDPHIIIDPENISREMDGIRNIIVTLAFMYQEGEGGFKELDENTHFEIFNPEDDEE